MTGNDDRSCRPWDALGRVAVTPEPVSPPGLQVRGKYPPKSKVVHCMVLHSGGGFCSHVGHCMVLHSGGSFCLLVVCTCMAHTRDRGAAGSVWGGKCSLHQYTELGLYHLTGHPVPIHRNGARPTITGAGGRSDFPDCCSRARLMSGEESEARSSVRVSGLVC